MGTNPTMRTSLLAAPLVLAVTLATAALCCAATIADSCNAIRDFADVAFCVSRLRSVPGAASADRYGQWRSQESRQEGLLPLLPPLAPPLLLPSQICRRGLGGASWRLQ